MYEHVVCIHTIRDVCTFVVMCLHMSGEYMYEQVFGIHTLERYVSVVLAYMGKRMLRYLIVRVRGVVIGRAHLFIRSDWESYEVFWLSSIRSDRESYGVR